MCLGKFVFLDPDKKNPIIVVTDQDVSRLSEDILSEQRPYTKERKIFRNLFVFFTSLFLLLVLVASLYLSRPDPGGAPSEVKDRLVVLGSIVSIVTTCIGSIISVLGFISTLILGWRKEVRETRALELERRRLEIELEKGQHELETSRAQPDDMMARHKERDQQVFDEISKVLPNHGTINWLREYDFGSAFRYGWLRDLRRFEEKLNDPSFEFLDAELEKLRITLQEKVSEFNQVIGSETFPTHPIGKDDMVGRIPYEMSYESTERFKKIQDRINGLAEEIVKIYDDLVRQARRKL